MGFIERLHLTPNVLTLEVEVGEIFPPLKDLHTPYRKRLNDGINTDDG